jgi:hypothetical protein
VGAAEDLPDGLEVERRRGRPRVRRAGGEHLGEAALRRDVLGVGAAGVRLGQLEGDQGGEARG